MSFVLLLPSYSSCLFLLLQVYYHCLPLVSPLFLFSPLVIEFVLGEIGIQERRIVLLPLFWGVTSGFSFTTDVMAWN